VHGRIRQAEIDDRAELDQAPESFKRAVAAIVGPGTTIVVTADSLRLGATGTAVTVIEDAPHKD